MLDENSFFIVRIKKGEQLHTHLARRIKDTDGGIIFCDAFDDSILYEMYPFQRETFDMTYEKLPAKTLSEAWKALHTRSNQPQPPRIYIESSGRQFKKRI